MPSEVFSPVVLTILIGGVVTIIGALVTGIISIITAIRAVKTETLAQTVKIDAIGKEAAVISGHVNSEKSQAQGREETLKRENELLREQLAYMKTTAGLAAQAAAQRTRTNGVSGKPQAVEVVNQPITVTAAPDSADKAE